MRTACGALPAGSDRTPSGLRPWRRAASTTAAAEDEASILRKMDARVRPLEGRRRATIRDRRDVGSRALNVDIVVPTGEADSRTCTWSRCRPDAELSTFSSRVYTSEQRGCRVSWWCAGLCVAGAPLPLSVPLAALPRGSCFCRGAWGAAAATALQPPRQMSAFPHALALSAPLAVTRCSGQAQTDAPSASKLTRTYSVGEMLQLRNRLVARASSASRCLSSTPGGAHVSKVRCDARAHGFWVVMALLESWARR